jgi:hypothetical protein
MSLDDKYMTAMSNVRLDELIDRYMTAMSKDFDKHGYKNIKKAWMAEQGRKYTKIVSGYVCEDGGIAQRSVVAFIDKSTGDVFKPANWSSPAKGVRYNLYQDIDQLEKTCDYSGGHLYNR